MDNGGTVGGTNAFAGPSAIGHDMGHFAAPHGATGKYKHGISSGMTTAGAHHGDGQHGSIAEGIHKCFTNSTFVNTGMRGEAQPLGSLLVILRDHFKAQQSIKKAGNQDLTPT